MTEPRCTRHVPGYGPCGLPADAHRPSRMNHPYEHREATVTDPVHVEQAGHAWAATDLADTLADRLSVALGAEPPDACPGDLAIAAETVVVGWLRDQADRPDPSDTRLIRRGALHRMADAIERGEA